MDEFPLCLPDGELLTLQLPGLDNRSSGHSSPAPSPSLDFNDNEDLPTELSDSSETHDEGLCRLHTSTPTHSRTCTHSLFHSLKHTVTVYV